jgi:hypothetical protein
MSMSMSMSIDRNVGGVGFVPGAHRANGPADRARTRSSGGMHLRAGAALRFGATPPARAQRVPRTTGGIGQPSGGQGRTRRPVARGLLKEIVAGRKWRGI